MSRALATCSLTTLILMLSGCAAPSERLNAPPQGSSPRPHLLQEHYVYMQDNALLADMCFSDVHFIPHTDELNGLGARRLNRYASLLSHYGGTLHYDTQLDEGDPLVEARLKHAAEYLQLAGLDADKFELAVGPPGGRGLNAKEAVEGLRASRAATGSKTCGPSAASAMTGK